MSYRKNIGAKLKRNVRRFGHPEQHSGSRSRKKIKPTFGRDSGFKKTAGSGSGSGSRWPLTRTHVEYELSNWFKNTVARQLWSASAAAAEASVLGFWSASAARRRQTTHLRLPSILSYPEEVARMVGAFRDAFSAAATGGNGVHYASI